MLGDREYYLFDGRACGGQGTGDAAVLTISDSIKEANVDARDFGSCALYEFVEDAEGIMHEYKWIKDYHD